LNTLNKRTTCRDEATNASCCDEPQRAGGQHGSGDAVPVKRASVRRAGTSSARGLVLALALALLAAACGGARESTRGQARPDATQGLPAGGPSDGTVATILPSVDVLDVVSGNRVNLAGLAPADRPTLLWFWAPH
jgi:hypothetical protein